MAVDYKYYEFKSYEYLVTLLQLWNGMEDVPQVAEWCKDIRNEQEMMRTRRFRVAVVGEFRKGKSTFINALLGQEILPADALPTTATINRITFGSVPRAYLCFKDGHREEVPVENLSDYVTKLTDQSKEIASKIDEAVVEYPSIFCQNYVDLIDTPGFNDTEALDEVTISRMERIDLVILAISQDNPFSETECGIMVRLLESEEIRQIVVVVTKIDLIRKQSDQEKLIFYLKERLLEKTLEALRKKYEEGDPIFEKYYRIFADLSVFGVSSLDALDARKYNDEGLFEKSGFGELNEQLPHLIMTGQNNSSILRSVHTLRMITDRFEQNLPVLQAYFDNGKSLIKSRRIEFGQKCYAVPDFALNAVRPVIASAMDELLGMKDSLHKDFIAALSSVRVFERNTIRDCLQRQADLSAKTLNDLVRNTIEPSLRQSLESGIPTGFSNALRGLSENVRADESWPEDIKKKILEMLDQISVNIGVKQGQFVLDDFSWGVSPVPETQYLLEDDLIVRVFQNLDAALKACCTRMTYKVENIVNAIREEMSAAMEKVVLEVYGMTNEYIRKLEEQEQALTGDAMRESVRQLAEKNNRLEESFMIQLGWKENAARNM